MSDSVSFWAAKSKGMKPPQVQAAVHAPIAECDAESKNIHSVKSSEKGIKKTNWADSDDDEEFLASFNSSALIQELEKTLVAKDVRITDLSSLLQKKDVRIVELDSALEKQNIHLAGLEGALDAHAAQVEDLKKENHKQFLRIERLVADVVKKDRRIAALETEVDEQCATIAELDLGDSSTQVSSQETSEASKLSPTDAVLEKSKVGEVPIVPPKETAQPGSFDEAGAPQSDFTLKPTNEVTAGPAVNTSTFPIFATIATIKQTTPPPPAPKLKMAVDLSKFAKKSIVKPIASKKKTDFPLADAGKDEPTPVIDSTSDIRTKSLEQRVLFANGPKVEVKMGEIALAVVPKYALMQCSSKASKHFSNYPDSTSFDLPAGSMDASAATAHLEWMREMTFQHRVYSITLHSDEKFDDKNLQICRAARVLGFNNMYVGHFTKIFCDRIRSNTMSDGFLSKVVAAAYPENDPIYDCLANNLANLRLRGALKNPVTIETLFQLNEGLKTKVEKIEERMRKKHGGARPHRSLKVVHVGRKMDV